VGVEECLRMEGDKTGALLACAASIGAVLGGADDRTADALEAYGHDLGLAFQAVDDLLGIWGDPRSTGKRTWSDLRRRKKSLPVVAAVAADNAAARRLTALLTADAKKPPAEFQDFDEAEFAERAALIEEAGGRGWTEAEARRRHTAALAAIEDLSMPDRVRERFRALADFVVIRER
ncbi:polyprenyl synthetase family protein, partial [Streptomyces calidiresistens]